MFSLLGYEVNILFTKQQQNNYSDISTAANEAEKHLVFPQIYFSRFCFQILSTYIFVEPAFYDIFFPRICLLFTFFNAKSIYRPPTYTVDFFVSCVPRNRLPIFN